MFIFQIPLVQVTTIQNTKAHFTTFEIKTIEITTIQVTKIQTITFQIPIIQMRHFNFLRLDATV